RPCGTFFAPIIVGEKYCNVLDALPTSGTCDCRNGTCTVNIEGCEETCTNTWSFDTNDPKDVDVTYKCDDGRSGSDPDHLVHYLNSSDSDPIYSPSEMVALCSLGINIET